MSAEQRIPNQYIVVLKDSVGDVDSEAIRLTREFGGDREGGHTYHSAIKGFSVRMPEQQALRLANDPRVAFVEEDGVVNLVTTQSNATWGLDRIDQRDLPLDTFYNYNATGSGVKAYIIDTGIRATHTQIAGRVISGFTAINDGLGTNDVNGHGTHVSGTVGGSTYGVAKNVTLVAVRVLDSSGSGTNSGVISGVDFVTSDHQAGQPAVANMSLGGGISSALDTAVSNSIADGVTYAIAAGNSNVDACTTSPARVSTAITVGATTITDARASFSNFGTCLDIFAPGNNITSSWNTSDTATNTISGTSMATPHVTGVAALFLETNPTASPATVAAAIINNSTPNKVTSA
jgi:subtilisin family serine protease